MTLTTSGIGSYPNGHSPLTKSKKMIVQFEKNDIRFIQYVFTGHCPQNSTSQRFLMKIINVVNLTSHIIEMIRMSFLSNIGNHKIGKWSLSNGAFQIVLSFPYRLCSTNQGLEIHLKC